LLLTLPLAACSHGVTALAEIQPVGVDSARLLRVAGALAHDSMQGRAAGTPGGSMARQLVIQELTARGVEPLGGKYEHPFEYSRSGNTVRAANVLGLIRGSERPDRFIVASAHYDHVGVRAGVSTTADTTPRARRHCWSWPAGSPRTAAPLDRGGRSTPRKRGCAERGVHRPGAGAGGAIVANINMDMVGRNAQWLYAVGTFRYRSCGRYARAAADAP
jgi:hypothetical protein